MSGRWSALSAVLPVAAVLLAGCGSKASSDPVEVVKSYHAAVNTADIDKAMSYLSADAVLADGTGVYRGEFIRPHFETRTDAREDPSNYRVNGERVTYDFVVKRKSTGEIFDRGSEGLALVRHGKIVFDGTERSEKLVR